MLPLEWVMDPETWEPDADAMLRLYTGVMFGMGRMGGVPWMVTLMHVRSSIVAAVERDTPGERMIIPVGTSGVELLTLEGAYRSVFTRLGLDRGRQDLQEGWFAAVMEQARAETERTFLLAAAAACDDADDADADEDADDED